MPDGVDRLFQRLAACYGKHWLDMWIGIPLDAVKAEWREELRRFHPVQIDHAMSNLGKFPPTLPEFSGLCSQFRRPEVPATLRLAQPRAKVPESTFKRLHDLIRER